MFVFQDTNNFDTHNDFAFAKSICEKLLDRNLWFITLKVSQQQLVSVFYKSVITFSLKFKTFFTYEFRNQWRIDK